jgi:hypothetical protein
LYLYQYNIELHKTLIEITGARSYIFTSPGMYYKEEGRTLFGGPKVKVEFRHLFFCKLQSWAQTCAVLVIGLYELLGNPTI